MSSLAVIVGIDDYVFQPLTTACRDAVAFRDVLLKLNLVGETEVVLLTSPARQDSVVACRKGIIDALREVYDQAASLDRFFFYFAGHGLSAWTSASRSSAITAVIPGDVVDLGDANLLLNVDDFRSRMELAGPAEQYFFVDACRDLAFGDRPGDVPGLGWPASKQPRVTPAAQALLFAVSLGAKALAKREGMGVMSEHLVSALHGNVALDWSDDEDAFVVTSESIARHVQSAVKETLVGHPLWQRHHMVPDFRPAGPPLAPLRIVPSPPRPTFRLNFDPLAAADWTRVHLKLRGQPLQQPCWPPRRPGEAVPLDPQVYRIEVEADRGSVTAEPVKIDLRRVQDATIRFTDDLVPTAPPPQPGSGPGEAHVHIRIAPGPPPGLGTVRAQADEPQTVIELAQQDPPYRRWQAAPSFVGPWDAPDLNHPWQPRGVQLHEDVPPGSYTIRFRLGDNAYSEADFDVVGGQIAEIEPNAERSATLLEAVPPAPDGSVILSETIGPMRTSALLTALPIVGVLPFDTNRELFSRFRYSLDSAVHTVDIEMYGGSAVRVVVAADGDGWPMPASEVAAGVRCELTSRVLPPVQLPLEALASGNQGWARLVHGTLAAPAPSFTMRFSSPVLGEIELAAAALPNRLTVVGLVINPDGQLDVTQHLMRVPGRYYPDEPAPQIPYGRMLRELVLGQRLYASNELITHGAVPNTQALRDLLFAKWTDPILGCMAYYAWNDAVARGLPDAQGVAPSNTMITAQNLVHHFPGLPDARVIGSLAGLPDAPTMAEALRPHELPVLARSLREAAHSAPGSAELNRWSSRVSTGSPWTLVWRSDDVLHAGSDIGSAVEG